MASLLGYFPLAQPEAPTQYEGERRADRAPQPLGKNHYEQAANGRMLRSMGS